MLSKLFDSNGHINQKYLLMIRDVKDYINYLPKRLFNKITEHFVECKICSDRLNNEFLNEIEDKKKFELKFYDYFEKNSIDINKPVEIEECDNNKFYFKSNRKKYKIEKNNIFFQDNERTCYYIKHDIILIGMVSFKIEKKPQMILERILFRPQKTIDREKELFKKLKSNKTLFQLSTIKNVFDIINT